MLVKKISNRWLVGADPGIEYNGHEPTENEYPANQTVVPNSGIILKTLKKKSAHRQSCPSRLKKQEFPRNKHRIVLRGYSVIATTHSAERNQASCSDTDAPTLNLK